MSNATALATVDHGALAAPTAYNAEQVQLIKDTYAKGATDSELKLFVQIAERKGLDIFSKQICLIPRWDGMLKKEVRDPQTTIDGYRLIAERTGRYVPGQDAELKFDSKGKLISATAFVKKLVGGDWHVIAATAFYDEYVQLTKEGNPNRTWTKMPRLMLAKCAEALALRKAFPAELSGIYTQEEMGQAENAVTIDAQRVEVEAEPKRNTPVQPDDNDRQARVKNMKRYAFDNTPVKDSDAWKIFVCSGLGVKREDYDDQLIQSCTDEQFAELEEALTAMAGK